MKNILFLTLLSLSLTGYGQNSIDTVYVKSGQTTYLVFPKDVDLVDIPNKEFVKTTDGKTVFIKTNSPNPGNSTFLVKCGDDYFQGQVIFKNSVNKTFYDFRNYEQTVITTSSVKTVVKDERAEMLDTAKLVFKDRLQAMKTKATKYKTVGIIQDNIYFGLSVMEHSNIATFIKLKVSNNSNINYLVDFVAFEVTENKSIIRNEIKDYMEDVPRSVASKESAYLYYVLPLVAIPENTDLRVTLREKNGLRTVNLFIPSREISKAPSY